MKRVLPVILAFLCTVALSQELLRIVNGTEERASIPAGLPVAVTNAYAQQLHAAGYRPVVEVNTARSDWCTRAVRTLTLTNDVWRVEWIECPVPVPLDPVKLCTAVLAMPEGTNRLSAAMSVPAVAEWFVGNPVYTRGSELAGVMQQLLGISSVSNLEALIRPCAVGGLR